MSSVVAANHRSLSHRAALFVFQTVRAMRAGSLPACRYLPTCSAYAVEAVEIHGPWKGTWLAIRRVGRCHPLGSHGHDPVPPGSVASSTPSPASNPSLETTDV